MRTLTDDELSSNLLCGDRRPEIVEEALGRYVDLSDMAAEVASAYDRLHREDVQDNVSSVNNAFIDIDVIKKDLDDLRAAAERFDDELTKKTRNHDEAVRMYFKHIDGKVSDYLIDLTERIDHGKL